MGMKSIYVSDNDKSFWDRLEKEGEALDRKISYMVNQLVRQHVLNREMTRRLRTIDDVARDISTLADELKLIDQRNNAETLPPCSVTKVDDEYGELVCAKETHTGKSHKTADGVEFHDVYGVAIGLSDAAALEARKAS